MDHDDFGHKPGLPSMDRGPGAVPPRKVGHTCPAIDNLKRVLRRGMAASPDRDRAFELIEHLRQENKALRDRATWAEGQLKARKGGF